MGGGGGGGGGVGGWACDPGICKTMALVTGRDVEVVCGVEQLATGPKAGSEGAVHGMTALYDEFCDDGWGFLFLMHLT